MSSQGVWLLRSEREFSSNLFGIALTIYLSLYPSPLKGREGPISPSGGEGYID